MSIRMVISTTEHFNFYVYNSDNASMIMIMTTIMVTKLNYQA